MANVEKEINKMELDITQVTRTKSILNQNQIQKIWNSTPAKFKYLRPAKGGGQWTYIKGSYVRKVLDSIFGFRWDIERTTTDTEIMEYMKMGIKQVVVHVKLTGWVKTDGEWIPIIKTATGRADIKFKRDKPDEPMDFGNDIKAAETDGFKKAASKLGIGADVYEADEFQEILITDSEEQKSAGAKRVADKLKKAQDKKTIKKAATKVGEQNDKGGKVS